MSLQTILSVAETVGINDHKFAGQMMSRNMRISTSEILTSQPFMFTMKPNNYLLYSQNKAVLSSLRVADRITEQYLNFGSTGWVNYIAYGGQMTSAEIIACQIQTTTTGKTIVLGSIPGTVAAGEYVVRAGDFIQIDRYAYIATADVLRGGNPTVDIPVHRSVLTTVSSPVGAVIGQYGTTTALGGSTYTGVTFCVVAREYPTYDLVPITNDSFISWTGAFSATEVIL
jgi:hypothetical protein